MKIIIIILSCFVLSSSFASTNKSLWGFGGVNYGKANLESSVAGEAGQKEGSQYGLQLSGLYTTDDWAVNSTFSWIDLNFDSEYVDGKKVDLKSRTFTLDVSALWKPHHRWYIGPKFTQVVADEIIVGPGSGNTTSKMWGLTAMYEIPWKKRKIRTGIHLNQFAGIGDRSAQIILFSVEIGQLIIQNNQNVTVTKKRFQEKATETISLNEQIVNFETGSSELKPKSKRFLNSLGSTLRDMRNDWEVLRIEGHTDLRGPGKFNMKLSQSRVNSVVSALLDGGVPKMRISGEAFGEQKPIIPKAKTSKAHAQNRRVEMKFIGRTNAAKINRIIRELLD